MNIYKACKVLDIVINNYNNKIIKKAYYKLALKWHPDKNKDSNSNEKFNEIVEAYNFLILNDSFDNTISYKSLLSKFISFTGLDNDKSNINNILYEISKNITNKAFDNIDKNTLINTYDIIKKYHNIIGINKDLLNYINEIMESKMLVNDIIILNPTIDNLLNSDIYKLHYNNQDIYIPLWHNEMEYDISNISLMVKCSPDISDNIFIDDDNSILFDLSLNIQTLLNTNDNVYTFNIGSKVFDLSIDKIKIKKTQTIILNNQGIPIINTNNYLCDIKKSNIYININLF
jgi:hypothetical protein